MTKSVYPLRQVVIATAMAAAAYAPPGQAQTEPEAAGEPPTVDAPSTHQLDLAETEEQGENGL